jgi:endonuclease/exonuclease/phosphatase family metal-dependent hydrolase
MRLIFLLFLSVALAADIISVSSWNVLRLSSHTIHKKDKSVFRNYFKKDYDVFVLTEVLNKEPLYSLTDKRVLFSKKTGTTTYKEFIAFVVSKKYKDLKVLNYYDSHNSFERDPAMLVVNNSFGVVGVHLVYGRRKSSSGGLTKKEIKALKNLVTYFSHKSGLPEDRIFIAGDFNLKPSLIEPILPPGLKLLIKDPTTVSTSKKRLGKNSYDHFIVSKNIQVLSSNVLYSILKNKSKSERVLFRKVVSDHYPIEAKLKF